MMENNWLNSLRSIVYLRRHGVLWTGKLPYIDMRCPPVFMVRGRLILGSGVQFFTSRTRTRIQVDEGASMSVGDGVIFNDVYTIRAAKEIMIGDYSGFGPLVTIYDWNFHPIFPGDSRGPETVHIGRNCGIAEKCCIYHGVTIDDHTYVGGNSVVLDDLPSKVLAAGHPARVVKDLKDHYINMEDWIRLEH
jgi:acetyltransferase-like isoleucine patch superfamily enzyme